MIPTGSGFERSSSSCGAGLRISEALALAETDLDPDRGAILVRHGKGGKRREVGMDRWAWEQLQPWIELRKTLPVGAFFCILHGSTRGRRCGPAGIRAQLDRTAVSAGVRRRFAQISSDMPTQLRCPELLRLHRHQQFAHEEGSPYQMLWRHQNLTRALTPAADRPRARQLGARTAIMRCCLTLVMVGGSLGLSSLTSTAVGGTSGTNGLASETPAQILAASRTAVGHVRFVQEVEQIGEGSHRSTVDLGLTSGAGLRMSAVGTGLGKCRDIVLAHGQSFINCDASFLVRMHVPDPSALAGKWLRVPSVTARSVGAGVGANAATTLTREIDTYLAASGSLTRGKEVTVDGRPAIPLSDESGNTRLFISATGQPYPIELTTINTSILLDRVRFSAFNVPIVLRPPAHWTACAKAGNSLRCAT